MLLARFRGDNWAAQIVGNLYPFLTAKVRGPRVFENVALYPCSCCAQSEGPEAIVGVLMAEGINPLPCKEKWSPGFNKEGVNRIERAVERWNNIHKNR